MDIQDKQNGVYLMRFTGSDTVYIGSTSGGFGRRRAQHIYRLRKQKHTNRHLQHAYDRYGEPALEFVIIEVIEDSKQFIAREQHWLDWFRSIGAVYNILPEAGTTRGRTGRPFTTERKKKLSDALTGRTLPPDHVEKLRQAWTIEARQAQSERKKGKKLNIVSTYSRKGVPQKKRPWKTYEGFIGPDGTEYRDILGLRAFAAEHGASHKALTEVDSGRILSYKGWRRITPVRVPQRNRVFNLVGPDGTHYTGIANLKAFCAEHGLQLTNMSAMYTGKRQQYKGWKRLVGP
jgi:group I intron endonuclease